MANEENVFVHSSNIGITENELMILQVGIECVPEYVNSSESKLTE